MQLLPPDHHSRRAFLRRSAQLALSGTALPFALNMGLFAVGALLVWIIGRSSQAPETPLPE